MLIDLRRDWSYIERVARERLDHNITAHHVDDYGDVIEIMGAAGELAARRYFGMDEELHVEFDGGVDFVYYDISIDVKATPLVDYLDRLHMQWGAAKPFSDDLDVILLVGVDVKEKKAELIGWATKEELQEAPVNLYRRTPCHEIKVPQLWRVKELYERKESKQYSKSGWLQTIKRKRRGESL